jgi:hypothetical protein
VALIPERRDGAQAPSIGTAQAPHIWSPKQHQRYSIGDIIRMPLLRALGETRASGFCFTEPELERGVEAEFQRRMS